MADDTKDALTIAEIKALGDKKKEGLPKSIALPVGVGVGIGKEQKHLFSHRSYSTTENTEDLPNGATIGARVK